MSDPIQEAHAKFTHAPLRERIFINSVPKCGTMLLRNIVTMFVPWDEIHFPFQHANTLDDCSELIREEKLKMFIGHVVYRPEASAFMRQFRHILIIRNPIDQVLSYARFFYTDQMCDGLEQARYVRDQQFGMDETVGIIIRGFRSNSQHHHAGVNDQFVNCAISWFNTDCLVIRYEELVNHLRILESDAASAYFRRLFDHLCIETPLDWRERVAAGADRRISITAQENLTGEVERANELSHGNRALFKALAPNLLEALGYDDEQSRLRLAAPAETRGILAEWRERFINIFPRGASESKHRAA